MRYRVVLSASGFYWLHQQDGPTGRWEIVKPYNACYTYWGARYALWRHKRWARRVDIRDRVVYEEGD